MFTSRNRSESFDRAVPTRASGRGGVLSQALLIAILGCVTVSAKAIPPNDDCSTPTPITGNGPFTFTMEGAAFTPRPACGTDIAHDVWFCWTASCDGSITISTCGQTTLDTLIELYRGCGCPSSVVPNPDLLCCNDDAVGTPGTPGCAPQSEVTCNVVCGEQYMIRIADRNFNGALGQGGGTFSIVCPVGCPPPQPAVCEDCCAGTPHFSGFSGTVAAVTQERSSGDPLLIDHAVDLIDISNQGSAPFGTNWCGAPFYLPSAAQGWTVQDVGTVFGVTLDDDGNIYLAHTSIYGPNVVFPAPIHDVLGSRAPAGQGAGAIYKINTNTGVSSHLVSLPNFLEASPATKFVTVPPASELYPGLGNICFDCRSSNLYVSNFEDGRVYRITKNGAIVESYDHATGAVTPWSGSAPEPSDPAGWCPLGERVWAVAVNQGRLYYSIWAEDRDAFFGGTNRVAPNYSVANEIWSIAVTPTGAITGVPQLEITMPVSTDPGMGNASNPVSDISFTDECCMLVAERVMHDDSSSGAHTARTLKFCQDAAGAWSQTTEQYLTATGAPNSGAGGVAFDSNTSATRQIWGTFDAMGNGAADCAGGALVYGFAGFPPTGGGTTYTNAIHVDIDRNTSAFDKFSLGSIDVSCVKCASLEDESILCDVGPDGPTGTYSYTYCLTNNTGVPVHYMLYPTLTPAVVWVAQNGPWLPGETRCFTSTLTGNPGDEICFPIVLADANVEDCCRIDLCVTLPDCSCLQFPRYQITCDPSGGGYNLTVILQNLAYSPMGHLFVIPDPPSSGVVVTPNYLPLVLPLYGTQLLNFSVAVPPGVDPLCLRFTIHTADLETCCSVVKCIDLPACDTGASLQCDANCDGVISVGDISAFVLAITDPMAYIAAYPSCPLSNSDTNNDGYVTVGDISSFVDCIVGQ